MNLSEELIPSVQRILRVPSCSSKNDERHLGNRDVIREIIQWVNGRLQYRVLPSSENSSDETLFLWPKTQDFPSRGGLALHTHLDTVPPGRLSEWTRSGPYEATLHPNQEIVGLGSADVKSDAICKILALMTILENKKSLPTRNCYFVGSFAEEIGMKGAQWLAREKPIAPEWALVGEPSANHICYANKGLLAFEGRLEFSWEESSLAETQMAFEGVSAHSSAPQKGKNALEMALDYLVAHPDFRVSSGSGSIALNVIPGHYEWTRSEKCIDLATQKKLIELRKAHQSFQAWLPTRSRMKDFDPSSATSSWTVLEFTDGALHYEWEARYLPGQDLREIVDFVQKKIPNDIYLARSSPAMAEKQNGEFGKALNRLRSSEQDWITKSGSNEAYFYQQLGAQVFVHGPGRSYGNIHKANECVGVESLQKAYHFYSKVIEELCFTSEKP